MIKTFLRYLTTPPTFTNAAHNQLAQALHYLLLLGIVLGNGFALSTFPFADDLSGPAIGVVMSLIFASLFWLLQQRKLQFVSISLILSSYIAIMFSLTVNGGLRDESALTLIAVLALAGFFLGERATVGLGILSVLAFVGLFVAERRQLITETEHISPVGADELLIALIAVGVTTVILRQLVTQIVDSNKKIRRQAEELKEQNKTLLLTQQAVLTAKEEAESANQAKTDFLSRLSHDLRAPLNSVIGFADLLLLDDTSVGKEKLDWLQYIRNTSVYMQTMINDLFDLSRIESGQLQLYPVEVPLYAFLLEIVALFQIRIETKAVEFVYQFDDELPDIFIVDETRLRQVLCNLLENAIKFTSQGRVVLKVQPVFMSDSDHRVRFEVADTGVGISSLDLESIFEPFIQSGERQQRQKGTGLGLSISQNLVDLLGGHLRVQSQLGEGSTFWFDLPCE